MGYEWAAWTGPWQFGFGLICLLVGAGLGCYALGLVRPMLRFRVSYHDAAVKFYDRADPRLRELIATLNGPDVLGYSKHALLDYAKDNGHILYGRRTLETGLEPMSAEVLSELWPHGAGADLGHLMADRPLWYDVHLSRWMLARCIRHYRNAAK